MAELPKVACERRKPCAGRRLQRTRSTAKKNFPDFPFFRARKKPVLASHIVEDLRTRNDTEGEKLAMTFCAPRSFALAVCRLLPLLVAAGCADIGDSPPTERPDRGVLAYGPRHFDLGIVEPGSVVEHHVTLRNPTSERVEIGKTEISCECVSVDLPKRSLAPGETINARIFLDFRQETNFHGDLQIEIEGQTNRGVRAFFLTMNVTVAPTKG